MIDREIKYTTNFDIFFFKQKTAYEMRISDWSSDVCSSDLVRRLEGARHVDEEHAYPAGYAVHRRDGKDRAHRGAHGAALGAGHRVGPPGLGGAGAECRDAVPPFDQTRRPGPSSRLRHTGDRSLRAQASGSSATSRLPLQPSPAANRQDTTRRAVTKNS